MHGDFIWYELITPDADAAQAFYAPLLGWQFRDAGMPDMDYRLFAGSEGDVGGVMPAADGMPAGWLGYVAVDDVDAMAKSVGDGGGTVHVPPTDIPNVGRFTFFADPQGAMIYAMTPAPMDGAPENHAFSYDRPRVGHCAWNELMTSDTAAALHFYGQRFGWVKDGEMDMGPLGKYEFLRHAGRAPDGSGPGKGMIGAVMPMMPGAPQSAWTYYFRVADIDAAKAAIEANGGQVLRGPDEIPGGDFSLNAVDPQGAVFALVGARKG